MKTCLEQKGEGEGEDSFVSDMIFHWINEAGERGIFQLYLFPYNFSVFKTDMNE